ncbi:MAG: hypothetical protein J6Z43_06745 [Clostridiales bacterium]|nr:hypothetical protein [Clostridiales bacterium]
MFPELLIAGIALLLDLAVLIAGCIVLFRRDRYAAWLGMYLAAAGFSSVLGNTSIFISRVVGAQVLGSIQVWISLAQILLPFATALFVFLYARRRYGLSYLWLIAVIGLPVASLLTSGYFRLGFDMHLKFIDSPYDKIAAAFGVAGDDFYVFGAYFSNAAGAVFTLILWIIFVFLYYRNREKEQVLPAIWGFAIAQALLIMLTAAVPLVVVVTGLPDILLLIASEIPVVLHAAFAGYCIFRCR